MYKIRGTWVPVRIVGAVLGALLGLVGVQSGAQVYFYDKLAPAPGVTGVFIQSIPVEGAVRDVRVSGGDLQVTRWVSPGAVERVDTYALPSGSGGGLNQAAVDARVRALIPVDETVVGLTEFEAAGRYEKDIVRNAAVTVAIGDASYAIPGAPKVPVADPDRELVVTVGGVARRLDLSALLVKPALGSVGLQLSSSNAVSWTAGGVTYFLARRSGTGEFLFGADTIGAYTVTIEDSLIDLEPWARRSDVGGEIPAAKLVNAPTNNAGVDARISTWARAGDTSVIPRAKLPPTLGGLRILRDGTTSGGLSLPDLTSTRYGTAQNLGLDLDDNPRGEFHFRINLTIATRNSVLLGFTPSGSLTEASASTTSFDGLAFASDVAALAAMTQQNVVATRHEVGTAVPVYGGDVEVIGRVHVYMSRTATGNAQFWLVWMPGEQDTGNMSIGIQAHVSFLASDAAPGGGGTESTGYGRGKLIATSSVFPTVAPGADNNVGVTWTLDAGAGSGYRVSSNSVYHLVDVASSFGANQIGYAVEFEVGGTLAGSRVLLPLGSVYPVADDSDNVVPIAALGSGRAVRVAVDPPASYNQWDWQLSFVGHNSTNFAANTVAKVYEWVR